VLPTRSMPALTGVENSTQASNDPEAHKGREDGKARGNSPLGAEIDIAITVLILVTVTPGLLGESTAVIRQGRALLEETIVCLSVVWLRALVLDPMERMK
jgi:hypothetical protein